MLVDGSEFAPKADAGEAAFRRWKMRDACARLQLIHNLSDMHIRKIRQTSTVREAWDTLFPQQQLGF